MSAAATPCGQPLSPQLPLRQLAAANTPTIFSNIKTNTLLVPSCINICFQPLNNHCTVTSMQHYCSVCDCACSTQGADAGMYDAFSEIHKFSTWQQVPQRGNPFCDKGGLREQRQSESCSKRHHGTREEDFSGRQRVFETLRDCTSISQQT